MVELGSDCEEFTRAAVLLLLCKRKGEDHIILTKRAVTVQYHAGEVSLPGGRYLVGDGGLETTALREGFEEIGINPKKVEMLGSLTEVHTDTSKFRITPFVARLSRPYELQVNNLEVEEVIEVPLSFLKDKKNYKGNHWVYMGQKIWGATARILLLFLDREYTQQ